VALNSFFQIPQGFGVPYEAKPRCFFCFGHRTIAVFSEFNANYPNPVEAGMTIEY
jgi:hypothetical protein